MAQSMVKKGVVGTLIFLGVMLGILIVFLDFWLKLGLEFGLGKANQAEVNIERVSHSFSPFGVSLHQLQLTNPSQPENNRATIETLSAQVNLMPLLRSHLIMDEMVVAKVQFNQPRHEPGEVYVSPEELQKQNEIALSLPDIDKIIENQPLKTPGAVEAVKTSYETHKVKLKEQYAALPTEETLTQYKQKLKQIQDVDFKDPASIVAATEQLQAFRDALKQDKEKLQRFRDTAQAAKTDIQTKLTELKQAPKQDYALVNGAIQGDASSINQITQALWQEQAEIATNYILQAHALLTQESEEAEDVQPVEDQTEPQLWIKKGNLSVVWQGEPIEVTFQDVTDSHQLIQKPTLYQLDMGKTSFWQQGKLFGEFRTDEDGLQGSQSWDFLNVKVPSSELLENSHMTASILSGLLNSSGKIDVVNDQLKGSMNFLFEQLSIKSSGDKGMYKILADTLSQTSKLDMTALVSGLASKPNIALKSNWDQLVSKAVGASLNQLADGKLDQFKAKLDGQVSQALEGVQGEQALLDSLLNNADDKNGQLAELLNAQLPKDKLLDQVKGKLFKKLLGN